MADYVDVAVPLPLPKALTYQVPSSLSALARVGSRVRVPVGRRRIVGIVVGHRDEAPEKVKTRPLLGILDREPLLPPDLLQLAEEASRYYLIPPGEMLRALIPADLPPWGDRRIRLSNAGALALPRTREEEVIIAALREQGRMSISDLVQATGDPKAQELIQQLQEEGRVIVSEDQRRGARYLSAVELAAGDLDELRQRCGRSAPGRQVVELLAGLGRPASVSELCDAVGCKPAVVRRLVSLGVLRRFTQIAKLSLDHHLLRPIDSLPIELRSDQEHALEALLEALEEHRYAGYLLAGITGSGKTEVYLRAVERVVAQGGSAILLVPEIALVPAVAGSARSRFGQRTAIFHSGMSASERHQEWERIRQGEARVVLGPRSAVFAPVVDLRLVVVDEEQDASYKQDHLPRYNGRDLAVLRAHLSSAVALLVSATPSLESRHNVEVGKLRQLTLHERVGHGSLPVGQLVDLRAETGSRRPGEIHFSSDLRDEIGRTLAAGDQVILLRNRRGYAPLMLCRACGDDSRCGDCGLPRTYHRREERLRCHYCGSTVAVPRRCSRCGEDTLEAIGSGTERVEEKVVELWPDAVAEVLDRDTARRGEAAAVLERFSRGDSRILIGTQMVSKGHHFPKVSLTGVLLADTYLSFPDFRAVEKTYSLLTQLAGRAGRGQRPGKVIIQTYHPEHYAIQAALSHDDSHFAAEEMRFRRMFHYPPYTRMIQILLRDTDRRRGESRILEISQRIADHPGSQGVRISGPAPAPFERLRGKWRFQLLLRHTSGKRLRELVDATLPKTGTSDLVIDIDPYELL